MKVRQGAVLLSQNLNKLGLGFDKDRDQIIDSKKVFTSQLPTQRHLDTLAGLGARW